MADAAGLIGLGVPDQVAKRVGWRVAALTAVGTVQGGGTVIANGENIIVNVTTAGGASAITLPVNAAVGDMVFVNNLASTDCLVFPDTGSTIGQLSANSNCLVDKGAIFIRTSSTSWGSTDVT